MILFVLPIKVISETQHHQILSCTEVVAIGFLDLRSLYGIPYMLMGEQITHSETDVKAFRYGIGYSQLRFRRSLLPCLWR
jgi:hypothetical protein